MVGLVPTCSTIPALHIRDETFFGNSSFKGPDGQTAEHNRRCSRVAVRGLPVSVGALTSRAGNTQTEAAFTFLDL